MSNQTILVIDDEINLTNLISVQLKAKGYLVEVANNGVEALEKLKKIEPNLIILDLNMPKMGGIEFYEKICDSNGTPKYPVFVFTGRGDLENLFRDFNVAGFITKPIDTNKLLNEIDIVLKKEVQDEQKKNLEVFKEELSVMLVDDDTEELEKLRSKFTNPDIKIMTANSGVSALEKMAANPPCLAVLNLRINDISGDLIVFKLQQMPKTKHIPCILYVKREFIYSTNATLIKNLSEKSGIEKIIDYVDVTQIYDQTMKTLDTYYYI